MSSTTTNTSPQQSYTTSNSTPLSYSQTSNNTTPIQADELPTTEDKVSHETYQKVLAERKRDQQKARELQARLDEIELARKQFEEETLRKKEDYKTLAENERRDKEAALAKVKLFEEQRRQAEKMNAFFETLGNNQMKKKFWKDIPINEIIINPDTGEIDALSVKNAVDNMIRDYPEYLERSNVGMPSASPSVAVNGITYEQWLQLPTKEMPSRRKDIINK